jgi:hypothetical protein
MKQSNFIIELQYQYLNYITGIPVLYKILKKIHNTGKKNYTSDRQVQEIHFRIIGLCEHYNQTSNKVNNAINNNPGILLHNALFL